MFVIEKLSNFFSKSSEFYYSVVNVRFILCKKRSLDEQIMLYLLDCECKTLCKHQTQLCPFLDHLTIKI
jgi:hypothetical protein